MFTVRRARLADEAQVFALTRAFATSFTPEAEAFGKTFRRLLEQEDALLVVGERGEELLGYLSAFDHSALCANGRLCWVEELMVRDDCRRMGLGGALMRQAEEWAQERGAKLVGLATRRAAPFYKAIGYEESAVYFRKRIRD